jgi:hypothetical protein
METMRRGMNDENLQLIWLCTNIAPDGVETAMNKSENTMSHLQASMLGEVERQYAQENETCAI